MRKPSDKMKAALRLLRRDGERSAYPGISMATLDACRARGLASASYPVGSMAFPRTSVKWTITEAGKVAVFTFRGE